MRIEFVIPGEPVGWQRAGENSRSGRHYTLDKTKQYECNAGWEYKKEAAKNGATGFFRPPVIVFITAWHRPPKSWTKKKRDEAFRDDAEVASFVVRKMYTKGPEDAPRTEVTVMDGDGYFAALGMVKEEIKKS